MKNKNLILSLLLIGQCITASDQAEELQRLTDEWYELHPGSPPHWMTPDEISRKDEIGRDFFPTEPPPGPVRNIAEFEPMEGVLIRYPFGIPYDIIAEMSEDVMVTTVVSGQSQENTVRNYYESNNVNLENCNFLHAPSESYWSRDYGPWYIVDGNNEVGIVNFVYNRPRPNDNDIPIEMAEFLDIPLYGMDIVHTGGNYMTDGMGISASSELVWEENNLNETQINAMVEDFLGVTTYHVIPDPNNTYINHIDCWGKFLDVDKILIREVPSSHAQYDEIEETVTYFANQTSSYGTPYEIYRVYTPQDQPYTNSLILNDKVLVPTTGSSWDDDAIASYENAMPGYEIIGFDGSWESTDALHCRTKGVADRGMLQIKHFPILGEVEPNIDGFEILVEVIALSESGLLNPKVYYCVDNGPYHLLYMWHAGGNYNSYSAIIPNIQTGGEIAYYINAQDGSGRIANHPFIGAADPHIFTIINDEIETVVQMHQGWNLIGTPLTLSDNYYESVYPTSTENTFYSFGYTGYASETDFTPGNGYWLHFAEEGSSQLTGYQIHEQQVYLIYGWNLITGITSPISVNDIVDADNIIVENTIYEFAGSSIGYLAADSLHPGKGYWIRSNGGSWITLIDTNH